MDNGRGQKWMLVDGRAKISFPENLAQKTEFGLRAVQKFCLRVVALAPRCLLAFLNLIFMQENIFLVVFATIDSGQNMAILLLFAVPPRNNSA